MTFTNTEASDDHKDPLTQERFLNSIFGKFFADKSYVHKDFAKLLFDDFQLITNVKNNMKNCLMTLSGKIPLRKHSVIKTVIALHLNGKLESFTGICKGEIATEKQGDKGFGYDPVFKAKGYTQTFAEISLEEKNKIGHRGKAVSQLIAFLNRFK